MIANPRTRRAEGDEPSHELLLYIFLRASERPVVFVSIMHVLSLPVKCGSMCRNVFRLSAQHLDQILLRFFPPVLPERSLVSE